MDHVCGLYFKQDDKRIYLPQVQLKSHTTINPVCFTTKLTQTFDNPNDAPLTQVRYTFPLYDGLAVNGYSISYGEKVIRGVVQQKDEAKKTFKAPVDRGETVGLLESLPAGVFGVTLGNVPAKTAVTADITYCGELKHDAAIDGLRYVLPNSIAPRYGDHPGEVLSSNAAARGGISITVDVDMAGSAIRKVQSPSHPVAVSMGALSTTESGDNTPFAPSQASATLTKGTTGLGDDFILQLLVDDISRPQAILETHPTIPNQRALMTTLVPKFHLEPANPEIVFIVDQSGSMGGSKNASLVQALKVFLKSLSFGVRFNICAFGSRYEFLFPTSQAYNEDNLNTALAFVDSFTASYGGTEILKPITETFARQLPDLPLEVMLLTDGEIWAESQVFEFINEQIGEKGVDARVFALGIGGDVSHTLVEGVARAGKGFAQFVAREEETDAKVMRMLRGALFAHTWDYAIETHYKDGPEEAMSDEDFEIVEKVHDCLTIADGEPAGPCREDKGGGKKAMSFFDTSADPDEPTERADRYAHLPPLPPPKLLQAPTAIPPLFPFTRTNLYLLLGPETAQKRPTSLTLRATSTQGPLELNIPVHLANGQGGDGVTSVHQLAARKAIQDLEEGRGWLHAATTTADDVVAVKARHAARFDELVERECVRLGKAFQVVGKHTAFVAVEAHSQGEREEGMAPEVEVRSQARKQMAPGTRMSSSDSCSLFASLPKQNGPGSGLFGGGGSSLFASSSKQNGQGSGLFGGGGSSLFAAGPKHTGPSSAPFGGSSSCGNALFASIPKQTGHGSSLFGGGASSSSLFSTFATPKPKHAPRDSAMLTTTPSSRPDPNAAYPESDSNSDSDEDMGFGLFDDGPPLLPPPPPGNPTAEAKEETEDSNSDSDSDSMHARFLRDFSDSEDEGEEEDAGATAATALPEVEIDPATLARYRREMQSAAAMPLPNEQDVDMDEPTTAAPAVAVTPRSDGETMVALINLQTFPGAWRLDTELLSLLGVREKPALGAESGGDVLATALAVAFLETRLRGKKAVWEFVVKKGRAWLAQALGGSGVRAGEAVERAKGMLGREAVV